MIFLPALIAVPVLAAPAPEGFAEIAASVMPGVVSVETMLKPADDGQPGSQVFEPTALGAGFIVDPTGYIVTNRHVTANAAHIGVALPDGRRFSARLVGADDETDVALLKITAPTPLPFVAWGDSSAMRVGDWVLAVGNPFGLGGTVTVGVVSGLEREIQGGRAAAYMQIDAPMGSGSSGGPTINRRGEVVGVNTAVYSTGGASLGIGFTLPSAIALPVVEELRRHGRVDWAWLGVELQDLTPEIARSLGLPSGGGALVIDVVSGAPADSAGIQQGDVILSVDGAALSGYRDLLRRIAAAGPGKRVSLAIWHDGKTVAASATLGIAPGGGPSPGAAAQPGAARAPSADTAPLGIALRPIEAADRARLLIPDALAGLLVCDVDPDGPAVEAGILLGDVVVRAGNHRVTSTHDVALAILEAQKANRDAVLLLVNRGGENHFIGVRLAQE